jgi:hypothetical protein
MTTTEALEAATAISEMIALDNTTTDAETEAELRENFNALHAILTERIGDLDHASLEAKLLFNMLKIGERHFYIAGL